MILQEGDPSPHDDDGTVTMVNSVRLGEQRPYCTGCGSPIYDEENRPITDHEGGEP